MKSVITFAILASTLHRKIHTYNRYLHTTYPLNFQLPNRYQQFQYLFRSGSTMLIWCSSIDIFFFFLHQVQNFLKRRRKNGEQFSYYIIQHLTPVRLHTLYLIIISEFYTFSIPTIGIYKFKISLRVAPCRTLIVGAYVSVNSIIIIPHY